MYHHQYCLYHAEGGFLYKRIPAESTVGSAQEVGGGSLRHHESFTVYNLLK